MSSFEVNVKVSLSEIAATLSEGQKIHLVNHIYKHYDIMPTKLVNYIKLLEEACGVTDDEC